MATDTFLKLLIHRLKGLISRASVYYQTLLDSLERSEVLILPVPTAVGSCKLFHASSFTDLFPAGEIQGLLRSV